MKCPACGFDNIEGVDRCEDCMEPFRDLDVPSPREGFQAHIMLDPVAPLFSPQPHCVGPQDTVAHAASIMKQAGIGCVPVLDSGKLAGVISEVDLLYDLSDGSRSPDLVMVSEVMTADPECVDESDSIAYALHLMSVGGYRHLPVMRNDRILGVLSIKDILHYLKTRLL